MVTSEKRQTPHSALRTRGASRGATAIRRSPRRGGEGPAFWGPVTRASRRALGEPFTCALGRVFGLGAVSRSHRSRLAGTGDRGVLGSVNVLARLYGVDEGFVTVAGISGSRHGSRGHVAVRRRASGGLAPALFRCTCPPRCRLALPRSLGPTFYDWPSPTPALLLPRNSAKPCLDCEAA